MWKWGELAFLLLDFLVGKGFQQVVLLTFPFLIRQTKSCLYSYSLNHRNNKTYHQKKRNNESSPILAKKKNSKKTPMTPIFASNKNHKTNHQKQRKAAMTHWQFSNFLFFFFPPLKKTHLRRASKIWPIDWRLNGWRWHMLGFSGRTRRLFFKRFNPKKKSWHVILGCREFENGLIGKPLERKPPQEIRPHEGAINHHCPSKLPRGGWHWGGA